jgi:hypothetical protein
MIIYDCHGGENQRLSAPAPGATGPLGVLGLCLAVQGSGGNGDPVVTAPCDGGAAQRWTRTAGGEFRGLNGRCLDVPGGRTENLTPLIFWDCHGGDNQRWDAVPQSVAAAE